MKMNKYFEKKIVWKKKEKKTKFAYFLVKDF